jgi:hypothetical protein
LQSITKDEDNQLTLTPASRRALQQFTGDDDVDFNTFRDLSRNEQLRLLIQTKQIAEDEYDGQVSPELLKILSTREHYGPDRPTTQTPPGYIWDPVAGSYIQPRTAPSWVGMPQSSALKTLGLERRYTPMGSPPTNLSQKRRTADYLAYAHESAGRQGMSMPEYIRWVEDTITARNKKEYDPGYGQPLPEFFNVLKAKFTDQPDMNKSEYARWVTDTYGQPYGYNNPAIPYPW